MNKKITYLFLALALPGLIFVFLKIFGKNHFDIPVFYKNGIADVGNGCSSGHEGQYVLPDSTLTVFKLKSDLTSLFVEDAQANHKEIEKLKQSFKSKLQIIPLSNIDPNRLEAIKNCILLLKKPWTAVLVDKQKRIRGYYAIPDREEEDRLSVEVEILISNN